MDSIGTTGAIIILAVLGLIILAILKKPLKLVLKLVLNTVIGFAALFLINFLGSFIGVTIAVNWINAAVVGIFGVPGVALLLLLRWLSVI